MLRYKVLAVVHQRQRHFFDTYLWCISNQQMNVIWEDSSLINGETTAGRDLYPVGDQSLPHLRVKYSAAEPGSQDEVMSQIEACVRGCENLGFWRSEAKYRRKRSCDVAVMLSLALEVALHRLDSAHARCCGPDNRAPKRRGEAEFVAYRS